MVYAGTECHTFHSVSAVYFVISTVRLVEYYSDIVSLTEEFELYLKANSDTEYKNVFSPGFRKSLQPLDDHGGIVVCECGYSHTTACSRHKTIKTYQSGFQASNFSMFDRRRHLKCPSQTKGRKEVSEHCDCTGMKKKHPGGLDFVSNTEMFRSTKTTNSSVPELNTTHCILQ